MKAESDPNVGITQLYVKMCKLSAWALQSGWIQINPQKVEVEDEDDDKDEELKEDEAAKTPDESLEFSEISCGDKNYVKGIGFQY